MQDKDYFIVYHYEFDTAGGKRAHAQNAHIFTSSATTRWQLYAEHLQDRREQCARDGVPWSDTPRLAIHGFDAKINKLN